MPPSDSCRRCRPALSFVVIFCLKYQTHKSSSALSCDCFLACCFSAAMWLEEVLVPETRKNKASVCTFWLFWLFVLCFIVAFPLLQECDRSLCVQEARALLLPLVSVCNTTIAWSGNHILFIPFSSSHIIQYVRNAPKSQENRPRLAPRFWLGLGMTLWLEIRNR